MCRRDVPEVLRMIHVDLIMLYYGVLARRIRSPEFISYPVGSHETQIQVYWELAEYEGVPDGPKLTEQDLVEDGFESSPAWYFGLIAEVDGAVAGHALCSRAYSSWTRRAFYLEDLYVRPPARRRGLGLALLAALCQKALEEGVHRIDWHVLADNEPALAFYRRLGAFDMFRQERRCAMRLERPRIEAVASRNLTPY